MKANKFNKLIKENKDNLQKVIYMHTQLKIYLTNKQLDKVIKLRGENMKKFSLGEVKKTVLKIKKDLMYNDNVLVKFIVIDTEYIEVLISVKEVDYTVKKIDFLGLFDLVSLKEWIEVEIDSELKSMLNSYIYRK